MTVQSPLVDPAPVMHQAGIATVSQAVFEDVRVTLSRLGRGRLLHMSPDQLLASPAWMLWIVDSRVPGAMPLVRRLLAEHHPHGMVISSPNDTEFIREHVRMGLPALVMHRDVEPPMPGPANRLMLTRREIEVVALMAQGLSNSQIATELGISMLTVKSHLARIYRRTGARDRAHMVLLAMREKLIA